MDTPPPLIAYAIPVFFLLIGIELLLEMRTKKRLYRLNDAVNDLTMGIFSRLAGIFLDVGLYTAIYYLLYQDYSFFTMTRAGIGPGLIDFSWSGPWAVGAICVLTFFLVDHQYYWFHRISHQVAIVWGSHEPHHQSEEYNLAVALRQGSFQGYFSSPFYFPLALLGISPWIFGVFRQLNTIYQFWIHTRLVGKMGFLESFLNTPSHHRVHHGVNPKYVDKNHAGTLIIWDKLYGTFQEEEEEPVYGTVKPLASWNPAWANVQYWWGMLKSMVRTPGLLNKIKILYKPPGWKPESLGGSSPIPEASRETFEFYDPDPGPGMKPYAFMQFLTGLFAMVYLLFFAQKTPHIEPIGWVAGIVSFWTLLNVGLLFEGRRLGKQLEWIRLAAIAGALLSQGLLVVGNPVLIGILAYLAISSVWLWKVDSAAGGSRTGPVLDSVSG